MRIPDVFASAAVVLLLAGATAPAWGESELHGASRVDKIEGSDLRQVILSDHAAARLGILTETLSGREISQSHRILGEIIASPYPEALLPVLEAEGLMPATVIHVTRTMEASSLALGQVAAVRLTGKSGDDGNLTARLIAIIAGETPGEPEDLFFVVDGADQALAPQHQVLVEFTTTEPLRKAVQSTALLYDAVGGTWVFVSPEPLVYLRHPVNVDFIQQDWAVLAEGPPDGTQVVTGGAMLLLGTEYGIGH
jgi:hypothetical protein